MRSAVALAASTSTGVVLSLGPYGATLRPGQEYAGLYPPPYGPGQDTNCASDPESYISVLAEFHLSRLRIYAADPSWDKVQWIAFETVPVLSEMAAIRRAMGQLAADGKTKPFWITAAFPGGKHGQLDEQGDSVPVLRVVEAMLGGEEVRPTGVGINCTNPGYLPSLLAQFAAAVKSLELETKPWLVAYPDGGAVYDVVSRTWTEASVGPDEWAQNLLGVVEGQEEWEGCVLGGCCKSSFAEIGALRRAVDRRAA